MLGRMRVFVILGQFGAIFSGGMFGLAKQIKAISPDINCTIHGWRDVQSIVNEINSLPSTIPGVLVGYSMGGNSTTQIALFSKRQIQLIVAYDASVLGEIWRLGRNVDRTVCFRSTNYTMPYGHAQLEGHNVVTINTSDVHLAVCYDQALHKITLEAIQAVGEPPDNPDNQFG